MQFEENFTQLIFWHCMIDILDVCLQIKSCLASLRNINWFHHRTTCFLSLPPPVLPEYPVVLNRWGRQLNGTTLGPKEEVIVQLAIIAGYKLQQSLSSLSRAMTYYWLVVLSEVSVRLQEALACLLLRYSMEWRFTLIQPLPTSFIIRLWKS